MTLGIYVQRNLRKTLKGQRLHSAREHAMSTPWFYYAFPSLDFEDSRFRGYKYEFVKPTLAVLNPNPVDRGEPNVRGFRTNRGRDSTRII